MGSFDMYRPAPPQAPQPPSGGFYAPPAIAMGPNGPINPGTGQPYNTGVTGGTLGSVQATDPRLTTQPQPSQQGPGGVAPAGTPGPLSPMQNAAQQRLQAILQQHPDSPFANIFRGLAAPQGQQFLQQRAAQQQSGMQTAAPVAARIGTLMGGGSFDPSSQAPQQGGFSGNITQAMTSPDFLQQLQSLYPQLAQDGTNGLASLTGSGYGGGTQRPSLPMPRF